MGELHYIIYFKIKVNGMFIDLISFYHLDQGIQKSFNHLRNCSFILTN